MDMEVVKSLILSQEQGTLAAAGVTGTLALMLGVVKLRQWWLLKRGKKMATLRQKYIFSDILTDALEEAVHRGKMSRQESLHWYRQLGVSLKIEDLLPRNPQGWRGLKVRIKKERIIRRSMEKAGMIKPVNIPGPGPIPNVQQHVWPEQPKSVFSLKKSAA